MDTLYADTFFTKKNYISKRKEIRRLLRSAGFTMTDINTEYEKKYEIFPSDIFSATSKKARNKNAIFRIKKN